MVAGTAHRPYVYRALVPLIVRGVDAALPESLRRGLESLTRRSIVLRSRLRWEPEHASWFMLVFLIHWASLVIFGACMLELVGRAFRPSPGGALAAAAASIFLVAIHFGYQNFLYDFPQLALFTLALTLLLRRHVAVYYLLFPIGMLNKETFVLIVGVFALTQWRRLSSRALAVHLTAQLALAAAVLFALHAAYHRNPGTPVEFHLQRNLHYVVRPRQLVHDAIYWGFWIFALCYWREKKALASLALAVGGALVGVTLFLGYLGEYRDYYEVYPLLFLMVAHTWLRLLTRRPAADPWPI